MIASTAPEFRATFCVCLALVVLGGSSFTSGLYGQNPAPSITGLSTSSVLAQSPGFTLTISGTGFIPSSQVGWTPLFGGSLTVLTVTSQTATELQVTVPASLLAVPLPAGVQIEVFNPAPGGGLASANFDLLAPTPVINSLSPPSAPVGGGAMTLTINGANFLSSISQVFWESQAIPTTVVSQNLLTAQVSATLLQTAGAFNISVNNNPLSNFACGPGGCVAKHCFRSAESRSCHHVSIRRFCCRRQPRFYSHPDRKWIRVCEHGRSRGNSVDDHVAERHRDPSDGAGESARLSVGLPHSTLSDEPRPGGRSRLRRSPRGFDNSRAFTDRAAVRSCGRRPSDLGCDGAQDSSPVDSSGSMAWP